METSILNGSESAAVALLGNGFREAEAGWYRCPKKSVLSLHTLEYSHQASKNPCVGSERQPYSRIWRPSAADFGFVVDSCSCKMISGCYNKRGVPGTYCLGDNSKSWHLAKGKSDSRV